MADLNVHSFFVSTLYKFLTNMRQTYFEINISYVADVVKFHVCELLSLCNYSLTVGGLRSVLLIKQDRPEQLSEEKVMTSNMDKLAHNKT